MPCLGQRCGGDTYPKKNYHAAHIQSVFLYRNAIDTIDSFCMAFFNSTLNRVLRTLSLDSLFIFKLSPLPGLFPVLVPLIGDARFPAAMYTDLGAIGLTAMGWLSAMDTAQRLQREVVCWMVYSCVNVLTWIDSTGCLRRSTAIRGAGQQAVCRR